jgi:hypothetical protein
MSPDSLRFEADDGSFAVELDPGALGDTAASPWTIATTPDWERFQAMRLLGARFADGSVAAVVALRPAGATGHDAEGVTAVLDDRGKGAAGVHEALLSTELDRDRTVRRVGVELWTSEAPPPRRLAADRTDFASSESNGLFREATLMDARLDGEAGTAVFEVVKPTG